MTATELLQSQLAPPAVPLHIPAGINDMDNLTAALAYSAVGWFTLPVDPKVGSGKHPGSVVGENWPALSSRDPKVITGWFAGTDYGIALHCGRSGAVVLDVDDYDNIPDDVLAATETTECPYQSTRPDQPGRGHYLLTNTTGRRIGNGLGELATTPKWGEVRGANGVIIVAPSIHPDGGRYRWERTGHLPPIPDYLAEALPDSTTPESTASDAEAEKFLASHTESTRPEALVGLTKALKAKLAGGHSCHMSTLGVLTDAMAEAAAGYYDARTATQALYAIYRDTATSGTSTGRLLTESEAKHEYAGIVAWAIGQAEAGIDKARDRIADKYPDNVTELTAEELAGAEPTTVHRGQARIAYRVANRYADRLLNVSGLGWFHWDGARFRPDERGAATRAVLAELRRALADSLSDHDLARDVRKCESAAGVAGVLSLAGALESLSAAVADLDADPYLLNVANGALDLRTLELRPHAAADRITKVCRGAYRPEVHSPLWEAFLARILPDEDVRRFVQRLVGLGLYGAVREHVLGIWTGTGANGKSALDKAIRYALGDYAATAEPDLFMHREGAHPTGEMDLRGVRWVVVSESEKDRRLAEATMKRLTGGDTIRARRMRQDFVEFTPSHTPLLITNHLPRVSGDDKAIWRRLDVVPFTVEIPEAEQDGELDERLQLEADAILSWAVAGWRDYDKRGLAEPASVRQATDDYHRNSDALARFIAECCHVGPAVQSITGQLFEAWERWRIADGAAESLSLKAFGLGLTNRGYLPDKAANGKRWRKGISLRADDNGGDFA
jgi:putative DNA primase/helicase